MKNINKEGICKVPGRSVIFSAFYAGFCLCPKSVIITTLIVIKQCNNLRMFFASAFMLMYTAPSLLTC